MPVGWRQRPRGWIHTGVWGQAGLGQFGRAMLQNNGLGYCI